MKNPKDTADIINQDILTTQMYPFEKYQISNKNT